MDNGFLDIGDQIVTDPVLLAVFDGLRSTDRAHSQFLTPQMFASCGSPDAVLCALNWLASIKIIERRMSVMTDDGMMCPLSADEIMEVDTGGEYLHPNSGEPVPHDSFIVYFSVP